MHLPLRSYGMMQVCRMNGGKMRELFGIQAAAVHLICAVRIEELVKEMKKKYTMAYYNTGRFG